MGAKRCWFISSICIGFCFWQVAQAQRVSETKCQDYIQLASNDSFGGHLIPEPVVEKFTSMDCSTSVDLIVGGQEALVGEFPHQAVLGYPKKSNSSEIEFLCGGSLISEWYVLTAAHCTRPKIVRLGEHNLENENDGQQDFDVADFIFYSKYQSNHSNHDIALVQLAQEVHFNARIRPACLWTTELFNMSSAVASGFGRTSNNNTDTSSKLMKVKLDVFNSTICNNKYLFDRILEGGLSTKQLCVGSKGGGKDTCEGDSGSPLQVSLNIDTCVYHVVGLTSFGSPRCGVGEPSVAVYTRVASFLDWIELNVWPDEYWMT